VKGDQAIESRRNTFAVVTALALLLGGGVLYRALAAGYADLTAELPLPAGTLSGLPMAIASWTGRDVPVNERVIEATDTDDHVHRVYTLPGGGSVVLWIAYGVRARDLLPHRPEVCYPAGGWVLGDYQLADLTPRAGGTIPIRLMTFQRTGLRSDVARVLSYYLVDGEYSADASLLRSRAWRIGSRIRYVVQVQISCSNARSDAEADTLLKAFAEVSTPVLRECLEDAYTRQAGGGG
jgi:EpsI family protein